MTKRTATNPLAEQIEAAERRAKTRTRAEFRRLTGLSNGTFYTLLKTGRVDSLETLRKLKASGVRIPNEALAA